MKSVGLRLEGRATLPNSVQFELADTRCAECDQVELPGGRFEFEKQFD